MDPKPIARKWNRWRKGHWRLHLASGRALDFVGRVRTQNELGGPITEYEAESDAVEMFPHFDNVQVIERLDT